ncbi:MAG: hypothetical protein LBQ51_02315 [Desulfovibrio sp.]|jgi:hypothetical protein|nr:hypothetical protein [Desulfovibrio sp.]
MATLYEDWHSLSHSNEQAVSCFRKKLNYTVVRNYSWLCPQLYELEGYMGWGPGSREDYDGEGYPPKLHWAEHSVSAFCRMLTEVEPDNQLLSLIITAQSGNVVSGPAKMLAICLNSTLKLREGVIKVVYEKISDAHSGYTLGAARIYRALWWTQGKYALAVAGLVHLLFFPTSPSDVRRETERRKINFMYAKNHVSHEVEVPEVQEAILSCASI